MATIVVMILSFQLQNYRSYREASTLHFTKRSFRTNLPKDGRWIDVTQRATGIFGANGAGKSNLLHALMGLKYAVIHSVRDDQPTRTLRKNRFKQNDGEPTSFLIDYAAAGVRYRWELELNATGVTYEALQASDKGPWRLIFERHGGEIKFGAGSDIDRRTQENISGFLRPWALTFSAWSTVKSPGKHYDAVQWWREYLLDVPHGEHSQHKRHAWVLNLAKDKNWLELMSAVVQAADVGIVDVSINEEEAPPEVKEMIRRMNSALIQAEIEGLEPPEEEKAELKFISEYLEFTHAGTDDQFTLSEKQQSSGTKTWIDIAVPAIFACVHGGILVVDEIDGSLHSELVREIISYFTDPAMNRSGSQLLFTSHDLTLLGNHPEPALEREATWFVEKDRGVSSVFSLDEYKLRANHNVEKQYFQGAFGALPSPTRAQLQDSIAKLFESHSREGKHS